MKLDIVFLPAMKNILVLFMLFYCIPAFAQIGVVTSGKGQAPYSKAKREFYMEQLRHATTIFVLQYRDYAQKEAYSKVIEQNWKYTPYKIIPPGELPQYEGKTGFTFFTFNANYTGKHAHTQHLSYTLWAPMPDKKGRLKHQFFYANVLLYPRYNQQINMREYWRSKRKYDVNLMKCLEDSSIFNNWGPGYLAGYLKAINKQLESNENFDSWFQYHNEKLYELKQDTLFIPVYTQTKEAIWKAAYYTDSTFSEAGLRECYPYPIKFITNDELDRRITTSGKEVKYLLLTIDGSDKYIDIYSSTSGLIYNRMTYMSWTIKNLDMARIAEVIENLKISDK